MLQPSEEQTPPPQNKCMGDIEELAASYERKLIEVSDLKLQVRRWIKMFYSRETAPLPPQYNTIWIITLYLQRWTLKNLKKGFPDDVETFQF